MRQIFNAMLLPITWPLKKAIAVALRLLGIFALLVCVGCGDRSPADIEADAERSVAKLKPLFREVEQMERRLDAREAQTKEDRLTLKTLREKLATLADVKPAPTPTPTPGPSPVVPTPPAPAPLPKPALPLGEFNISADVKSWVETLVPPEGRATGVAHFVRAARAIIADCESGKITGWNRIALVGAIKDAIGRENATIPDDVRLHWKAFAAKFNARANELFTAGRLTAPEHWATLFKETITGLEAAK